MTSLTFKLFIALSIFIPCTAASAQTAFEEDIHYEVISSEPADKSLGIMEFYSFYCIHCYRYEPIASALKSEFGDTFQKIHLASMGPAKHSGAAMTNAYILATKLGIDEQISDAIFKQNFEKREMLTTADDIKAIFIENGITESDYERGINSFGVKTTAGR